MRLPLILLLLIATQFSNTLLGSTRQIALLQTDQLVVRRLNVEMPGPESDSSDHSTKAEEFLWAKFMNNDSAPKFPAITNKSWRKESAVFERTLVARAKESKLPHGALESALSAAKKSGLNEKLAALPVAAYLIRCEGQDAWAVIYNWEEDFDENAVFDMPPPQLPSKEPQNSLQLQKPPPLPLEHRRVFVYSVETGDLIGYTTCR